MNMMFCTQYSLALVRQDNSVISYNGKISNKYCYLKHLEKSNTLHFYHHRCELKLINNVTTQLRFFQENLQERKDFAAKFSIHIIPEPRSFKYYNYFDFFYFFEFYQIYKFDFQLNVGQAFYFYLTNNYTEIFTTFEKFSDPDGPYKGIFRL